MDEFIVLYVGRLHPDKNVSYLIKAFKEFHDSYPISSLWVVGDGYLKESLVEETKALDIANDVYFFGHIPNEHLGQFYAKTSVFVLPSIEETFGIVAVEAMLYAKPIILPKALVSAPDLIQDGINGYLIDANSVSDLALKLAYLRENPLLLEMMGKAAKEMALKFDVQSLMNQLESHYENLFNS